MRAIVMAGAVSALLLTASPVSAGMPVFVEIGGATAWEGTTFIDARCTAEGVGTFSSGYTVAVAGEAVSSDGLATFVDCLIYQRLGPIGKRVVARASGYAPGPAAVAFGIVSVPEVTGGSTVCVRAATLDPITRKFVNATDCPLDVT